MIIQDRWLTTQFLLTRLWDVLHSDGYSTIVETELANLRDRCGENRYGEDDDPCTDEERAVVNVVSALYELYRSYTKTVLPQMPDDVDVFIRDMLEKLDQWLPTHAIWLMENIEQGRIGSAPLAADLNIPHWGYFHAMYTYLELCKLMAATLRYAVAENRRQGKQAFIDQKWLETKVAKICHECKRLASMVSRSANELRDRLQGLATLQDIDQAVVGRVDDTEDLIGMEIQKFEDCRPAMTKFCRDIQGSWIEGLDGVIQTSVV